MKPILLFISFIFILSANAQTRTNLNSEEIITAKGKFDKNYNVKEPYIIPAQNISSLLEKEKAEFVDTAEAQTLPSIFRTSLSTGE